MGASGNSNSPSALVVACNTNSESAACKVILRSGNGPVLGIVHHAVHGGEHGGECGKGSGQQCCRHKK